MVGEWRRPEEDDSRGVQRWLIGPLLEEMLIDLERLDAAGFLRILAHGGGRGMKLARIREQFSHMHGWSIRPDYYAIPQKR